MNAPIAKKKNGAVYDISKSNPATAGPSILPIENPESSLAKALLLDSIELISATHPPDEGLVALPKIPFSSLADTNNRNKKVPVNKPLCPNEIVKLKSIKEIAKPERPTMTIFFRPIESLNDPHIGLKIIQANAEVAKIDPIWISFRPRSRAIGGIVIKTIDCPAPTHNKPAASTQIVLGSFSSDLLICNYE